MRRDGTIALYLTVKETAEYLSLPEETINKLIAENKLRAVFDGEQYLLNKEQFHTYLKQMETYKEMVEEYLSEPIPEDRDIKDED